MKEKLLTKIYFLVAMIITLLTIVLLLIATVAFGQEQPSLRDRAEELFQRYEYADAVPLYQKLVDRDHPRLQDIEHLAYSYWQMRDYESAENWYARVVEMKDSDVENRLRYGEVLKANGRYVEAKQQLAAYGELSGDRARVAVAMAGCDSALIWMANPTVHRLQNEEVNTTLSEFSAFPVGNKVYYTGEPDGYARGVDRYGWTGNAFLRVYTADRSTNNALSNSVLAVEEINGTSYHIGPVSANANGDTLYVTRTYSGNDGSLMHEGRRKYRTNKLELYIYTKKPGKKWYAEPFAYNRVAEYSVGHAALSEDGSILYFVSDRPGGQGGIDIWYSERQADGSWGTPINAGDVINSAGDELFPSVGVGNTLYYSSDGFAGLGGLDVFQSVGSGGLWSEPRSLRYPVNSSGDDFAYLIAGENEGGIAGYLSSNRKGGRGGDDIYSFTYEKPKIVILLKGTVSDKETGTRLADAAVTLYDGVREIVAKKTSDDAGMFMFMLDREKVYTVLGHQEKYHADSAKISTQGVVSSDTLEVALLLKPVFEVGKTFDLENIYYDFDKYDIRPDAAATLDELVRTMRDNPTLKIELASHTDSRGSDAYNMTLSQHRAQAAVDYLVTKGIARGRMVAHGYGETRLVNDCGNGVHCRPELHQANRRTEVTVLAF